eukprot:6478309-Amphidinium_carterae.1
MLANCLRSGSFAPFFQRAATVKMMPLCSFTLETRGACPPCLYRETVLDLRFSLNRLASFGQLSQRKWGIGKEFANMTGAG